MDAIGDSGAKQLKSFIERIERLEEEKAALGDDLKAVYAEAKAAGFDTKTIRRVVKLRKIADSDREEQAALLDLYCAAVGFDYTPLGRAARGLGKGDE